MRLLLLDMKPLFRMKSLLGIKIKHVLRMKLHLPAPYLMCDSGSSASGQFII